MTPFSREWTEEAIFTCPKFRDPHEFGRLFSFYVAPLSSTGTETPTSVQFLINGAEITIGSEKAITLEKNGTLH